MRIGGELIKIREELISQKDSFVGYFEDLHRVDDVNYHDHLFLIIDLYKHLISLFEYINEDFIIDNNLYSELTSLSTSCWNLNIECETFFNQDYIVKNEVRASTEDSATLVRIENILTNTINQWEKIKKEIDENDENDENILLSELLSFKKEKEKIDEEVSELKNVFEGWKNRDIYEIFKIDSDNFNKLAIRYEIAFYVVIFFAGLYFLGLTFYVTAFESKIISISFPEKIHGNLSIEFYIQKISFLILSTTLAAFLLKRSFMNRRLADEAYHTAKELDALPRYMAGMPEELKEKIRFDLAYKYFGNSIYHESYTSGENLMHENIKANTDFLKSVKSVDAEKGKSNEGLYKIFYRVRNVLYLLNFIISVWALFNRYYLFHEMVTD